MDVAVKIISKETIKPSSPTPPHLQTHKLSIYDQLIAPVFVPIVLFYSTTVQNPTKTSDHLKKSLSETLPLFYPLAGIVENGTYITCSDKGAKFVEAQVDSDMSKVLKQPEVSKLRLLLPCHTNRSILEDFIDEILAIQVNYFSCGGMAIGVCANHVSADASTVATLIKTWSAIARGVSNGGTESFIYDCTSLFPPMDTPDLPWSKFIVKEFFHIKPVTKRFVFDGSKIAALKAKVGDGPFLNQPTRFEAVSALILGAFISATRPRNGDTKVYIASTMVDLRKRMNPPLPQQCIGNVWQGTQAMCFIGSDYSVDCNELAGNIRDSVRKISDQYVRNFHAAGGMLNFLKNMGEDFKKNSGFGMINFSSWCRFPFYEGDFGWGKPIWVGTAMEYDKLIIFLDSPDGVGIEAWVSLSGEEMDHFERNPDVIEFAIVNPEV